MTAILQAAHYGEAEERLAKDPIVIALADEIRGALKAGQLTQADLTHEGGGARFDLMGRANAEYAARGGTGQAHIGAIANAILKLLAEEKSKIDYSAWTDGRFQGRSLGLTAYRAGEAAHRLKTTSVQELHAEALRLQEEGLSLRLDYYATLALIEIGAYGESWEDLRVKAVRELNEQYAGSGQGIGSSDVNHATVGLVYGREILA